MSDGTLSPLVKSKKGNKFTREKTLNLTEAIVNNQPVKIVKASDFGDSFAYNLKLEDENGTLIDDFNPLGEKVVCRSVAEHEVTHTIGENEELIGFYGVDDDPHGLHIFSRFGFIVKVTQPPSI